MSRIYSDTEIVIRGSFLNSSAVLTNPTAVEFHWRHARDTKETAVTPVNAGTGLYDATFEAKYAGLVFYRWKATTPTNAEEGTILIEPARFERQATTDYL